MNRIILKIGKLNISLVGVDLSQLPENAKLFLSKDVTYDIEYKFFFENLPQRIPFNVSCKKDDIIVFSKTDFLESRLLIFPDYQMAYAYYEEVDERHVSVYYNPRCIDFFNFDPVFYSLLALERHLNKRESYILHCAYLDYNNKAYLFSGPSGIGKTTHTDLWSKHFPSTARVLNGDKCLIEKRGNEFYALGWPICGSSGICFNEERKIAAIILLQQTPENQEIIEKRIRHIQRIFEQLTVNYWNHTFVNNALTFAEEMTNSVTCCTYGCNMEDSAVTVLQQILQNKNNEKE